jgi:hypothetical protein
MAVPLFICLVLLLAILFYFEQQMAIPFIYLFSTSIKLQMCWLCIAANILCYDSIVG